LTNALPGIKKSGGALYKWIDSDYNSTGIKVASGSINKSDSTIVRVVYNYVDDQFLSTLGMELVEGRNFNREFAEDTFNIIVNEAAVRAFGHSDIVGKDFYSWIFNENSGKIIGVIKDFHFQSMDKKVPPVVLFFLSQNLWKENLVLNLNSQAFKSTIDRLSNHWDEYGMTGPFEYTFLDQYQANLFKRETQSARFMGITATCSILVALIGLIGLVSFQNKRRSKELSLRKVFGASVSQLLLMINKTYLILIGLSIVISVPVAYWAVSQWLQGYAYRISPTIWDFGLVIAAVILVSFITVSLQSWKTAHSNPTDVLRSE
ncbi:MAG: FtsX-like permease family protein, partial [Cyclobacteriaceae bacterium]